MSLARRLGLGRAAWGRMGGSFGSQTRRYTEFHLPLEVKEDTYRRSVSPSPQQSSIREPADRTGGGSGGRSSGGGSGEGGRGGKGRSGMPMWMWPVAPMLAYGLAYSTDAMLEREEWYKRAKLEAFLRLTGHPGRAEQHRPRAEFHIYTCYDRQEDPIPEEEPTPRPTAPQSTAEKDDLHSLKQDLDRRLDTMVELIAATRREAAEALGQLDCDREEIHRRLDALAAQQHPTPTPTPTGPEGGRSSWLGWSLEAGFGAAVGLAAGWAVGHRMAPPESG